jgi:hypothetical protein
MLVLAPGRVLIIISAVVAAAIFTIGAYAAVADSPIELGNPTVMDKLRYGADFAFPGIADVTVHGYCQTLNNSATCYLTFGTALSTDGGPNFGLATRSMTMKLLNAQFSELAIASGTNVPVTPLQVAYSSDNSGGTSATIYTPFLSGGSTWTYDIVILNPPMTNGKPFLDLILGAQLVPTGLFGHGYDLRAEIQLPAS